VYFCIKVKPINTVIYTDSLPALLSGQSTRQGLIYEILKNLQKICLVLRVQYMDMWENKKMK